MHSNRMALVAGAAVLAACPRIRDINPGGYGEVRKSHTPMRTIHTGGTRRFGNTSRGSFKRAMGQRPDEQVFVITGYSGKIPKVKRLKGAARRAELSRRKTIAIERAAAEQALAESRAAAQAANAATKKKVAPRKKVTS